MVDENNTPKAPALVDGVIYIFDDKVEDLTSDTVKRDETRTDEIIKTEKYKIINEQISSLEEEKSDSDDEDGDNIPLEYDKNVRPKKKKETKGIQTNFSGKNYEEGVLNLQAEKMDLMSQLEVTEHV